MMKTQRSLSIFLSALTFAGTTATLANAVQAQDRIAQPTPISRMLRTLTVSGRGTESIQTTIAQVRLGVEAQGKTAGDVQAMLAKRSNAVVTFLKSRNVQKLETTGINLNPVYSYDNNKQVLTGYSGSNMVIFRTASDAAGDIVDQSVKSGASRIDGVNFIATDEAIAAAQKTALRRATQEAQAQSNAVLSGLNFTQKDIISIQIDNAIPRPRPLEMNVTALQSRSLKDIAAPTPILGGEQVVEASVTLEITY